MYNKLFGKILDSSIWLAPDPHRLVWITILAAMDEDGNVMFASAANLAARARVPREAAEAAVAAFEAPDPDSGDPDNEGRRIERFPCGWHVLNAAKYRAMVTKAIIREQTRIRVEKYRKKRSGNAEVTQQPSDVTPSVSEALAVSAARAESKSSAAPSVPALFVEPPLRPTSAPGSTPRTRREKSQAPTSAAWGAYAQAYAERYGTAPVSNAKINGLMSNLIARLGADEAPGVARFYLSHKHALYVGARHCVDLLVRDCERLRTEWVTGEQGTATGARLTDRTQTTLNAFAPLIAEARAREAKERDDA